MRNDNENKFQEVSNNIRGVIGALNERIDAPVVASRSVREDVPRNEC